MTEEKISQNKQLGLMKQSSSSFGFCPSSCFLTDYGVLEAGSASAQ
jgi:hypothetical protein